MTRLAKVLYNRFTQHIQVRLTWYFLLILLPLVLVSLFTNERSQHILQEEAGERTRGALLAAVEYIDLTMQTVDELSILLATDRNLIQLLEKTEEELTPQSIVDFSMMMREITNVTFINHKVSRISILHMPSEMMIMTDYGGKKIENAREHEVIQKAIEAGGGKIFYIPDGSDSIDSLGGTFEQDYIYLLRMIDIYNYTNDKQPNILILSVKKDTLIELTTPLLPSKNADIYLYSSDNQLVAGTGKIDSIPYWDSNSEEIEITNLREYDEAMFTVRAKSRFSNWSLLLVQPEKELYEKNKQLEMSTYIIIGISVLLALWISWALFRHISAPLANLIYGMKQIRLGNFDIRLSNQRKDELGYLVDSFNRMITDQKHLIQDHYEQQLRLSQTELKFLQSQINPHFLYNTLDTIYWTAKNYEASEISEMVLNLSKFFRLSLNKGQDTFSIAETAEHLNYYLRVQQLRFLDHFTVEYQIAEECQPIHIHKLLLQPLVENALLHGLEKKQGEGHLLIAAELEENYLRLKVQDNGVGIEEEKLKYILKELKSTGGRADLLTRNPVRDLFGLRNVLTRVQLYYGREADLQIYSKLGEGTTVILQLPIEQEESGQLRVKRSA